MINAVTLFSIISCYVFTESLLITMNKKKRHNSMIFEYIFPLFYRVLSIYWCLLLVFLIVMGSRLISRMRKLSFFETHFSKLSTVGFFVSIFLLSYFNIQKNYKESNDTEIISKFYDYHTPEELHYFCEDKMSGFELRFGLILQDFHFLQLFILLVIIKSGSSFEILVDLILLQD